MACSSTLDLIRAFLVFIQGAVPFFPSLFGEIEQMVHEVLRIIAPG
ncbi:hypothetical protein GGP97_002625 [Salinibacter ruber]|nr:hypothetical protein [Salinibacter ruber]